MFSFSRLSEYSSYCTILDEVEVFLGKFGKKSKSSLEEMSEPAFQHLIETRWI